eukprot:m.20589 g.20589  ORF g.20589 m.20589 type:complete len:1301 (+) comp3808_c0_seq1:651-4553(+)
MPVEVASTDEVVATGPGQQQTPASATVMAESPSPTMDLVSAAASPPVDTAAVDETVAQGTTEETETGAQSTTEETGDGPLTAVVEPAKVTQVAASITPPSDTSGTSGGASSPLDANSQGGKTSISPSTAPTGTGSGGASNVAVVSPPPPPSEAPIIKPPPNVVPPPPTTPAGKKASGAGGDSGPTSPPNGKAGEGDGTEGDEDDGKPGRLQPYRAPFLEMQLQGKIADEPMADDDEDDDSATYRARGPPPGNKFVCYHEELGSGAFKTVYKGMDVEEAIEVAWNEMKVQRLSSAEKKRLDAEVELLQKLRHKNVVQFFGNWTIQKGGTEIRIFITELMTSGTLKQFLRDTGTPKHEVLQNWCKQILSGLKYMHDKEIIHRDLKCDNIFIEGTTGEVKIGDLGLAMVFKDIAPKCSVIGTPEFMAPEMYREEYSFPIDVWAFGMCVLEMITLEYPYSECSNPAQIYRKVSQGIKPAAFSNITGRNAAVRRDFVLQCIKLEPSERATVAQLLKHDFFKAVADDSVKRVNKAMTTINVNKVSEDGNAEMVLRKHAEGEDKKRITFNMDVYHEQVDDMVETMVSEGLIALPDKNAIANTLRVAVTTAKADAERLKAAEAQHQADDAAAEGSPDATSVPPPPPIEGYEQSLKERRESARQAAAAKGQDGPSDGTAASDSAAAAAPTPAAPSEQQPQATVPTTSDAAPSQPQQAPPPQPQAPEAPLQQPPPPSNAGGGGQARAPTPGTTAAGPAPSDTTTSVSPRPVQVSPVEAVKAMSEAGSVASIDSVMSAPASTHMRSPNHAVNNHAHRGRLGSASSALSTTSNPPDRMQLARSRLGSAGSEWANMGSASVDATPPSARRSLASLHRPESASDAPPLSGSNVANSPSSSPPRSTSAGSSSWAHTTNGTATDLGATLTADSFPTVTADPDPALATPTGARRSSDEASASQDALMQDGSSALSDAPLTPTHILPAAPSNIIPPAGLQQGGELLALPLEKLEDKLLSLMSAGRYSEVVNFAVGLAKQHKESSSAASSQQNEVQRQQALSSSAVMKWAQDLPDVTTAGHRRSNGSASSIATDLSQTVPDAATLDDESKSKGRLPSAAPHQRPRRGSEPFVSGLPPAHCHARGYSSKPASTAGASLRGDGTPAGSVGEGLNGLADGRPTMGSHGGGLDSGGGSGGGASDSSGLRISHPSFHSPPQHQHQHKQQSPGGSVATDGAAPSLSQGQQAQQPPLTASDLVGPPPPSTATQKSKVQEAWARLADDPVGNLGLSQGSSSASSKKNGTLKNGKMNGGTLNGKRACR